MLLCPKSAMLSIYIQIVPCSFFAKIPTLNVHLQFMSLWAGSSPSQSQMLFPQQSLAFEHMTRILLMDKIWPTSWDGSNIAEKSDTISLRKSTLLNWILSMSIKKQRRDLQECTCKIWRLDKVSLQNDGFCLAFGQGIVIRKSWSSWFRMMYTYDTNITLVCRCQSVISN